MPSAKVRSNNGARSGALCRFSRNPLNGLTRLMQNTSLGIAAVDARPLPLRGGINQNGAHLPCSNRATCMTPIGPAPELCGCPLDSVVIVAPA